MLKLYWFKPISVKIYANLNSRNLLWYLTFGNASCRGNKRLPQAEQQKQQNNTQS